MQVSDVASISQHHDQQLNVATETSKCSTDVHRTRETRCTVNERVHSPTREESPAEGNSARHLDDTAAQESGPMAASVHSLDRATATFEGPSRDEQEEDTFGGACELRRSAGEAGDGCRAEPEVRTGGTEMPRSDRAQRHVVPPEAATNNDDTASHHGQCDGASLAALHLLATAPRQATARATESGISLKPSPLAARKSLGNRSVTDREESLATVLAAAPAATALGSEPGGAAPRTGAVAKSSPRTGARRASREEAPRVRRAWSLAALAPDPAGSPGRSSPVAGRRPRSSTPHPTARQPHGTDTSCSASTPVAPGGWTERGAGGGERPCSSPCYGQLGDRWPPGDVLPAGVLERKLQHLLSEGGDD
ncbi:unnamed protein product [Lampetra planeri]